MVDLYGYKDGDYKYNRPDTEIREYVDALRAKKIQVGGWGYTYPEQPGPQGAYASERIEKFDLEFWFVNAEKEWKQPGLGGEAELHMTSISHNKKTPVLLCSYRYPSLHAPFPFAKFLHNCQGANPQVYWMKAHNPAEQLERSYEEHQTLLTEGQMFVPIGSAFGEGGWIATPEELEEFEAKCDQMDFNTRGYWSLDYILKKGRWDFMEAIFGKPTAPPPQPPPALPVPIGVVEVINPSGLNERNKPSRSGTWMGIHSKGVKLYVFDKVIEGDNIWLCISPGLYVAEKYLGKVMVKWLG